MDLVYNRTVSNFCSADKMVLIENPCLQLTVKGLENRFFEPTVHLFLQRRKTGFPAKPNYLPADVEFTVV
jgi:hypothetical protein